MLGRDKRRRDPNHSIELKEVILCLVVLACCALTIGNIQAHKVFHCELVDRLFAACNQCKICYYDTLKASQNTF